jgi:tetratricopeptide (TPR) repeat protein
MRDRIKKKTAKRRGQKKGTKASHGRTNGDRNAFKRGAKHAYAVLQDSPALDRPTAKLSEVEPQLVPYDKRLVERARIHWQFGDWDRLAALDRVALQHHPERAKLALLAAAGYLQQGDNDGACDLIRLAQDWGCTKKLVSQILIAGVHNTLGRAAAVAGQPSRAQQHFKSAIAIGAPGSETRLIAQARATHQLADLGLDREVRSFSALSTSGLQARATTGTPLNQASNAHPPLGEQKKILDTLREEVRKLLKKEVLNSTKQLEALVTIQNYLNSGELVGEMHGWAISPDFALHLVKMIEEKDYDVVIEFGSGTSTVLIAKALARNATRRQEKKPCVQIAFEHLAEYHAQSLAQLSQAGLADRVELVLAPLVPYVGPNGTTYSYYDCHKALESLARSLNGSGHRVLVLVDGPPGGTGKHARYPAVPVVLSFFAKDRVDVLLDDFAREDERQIADSWMGHIKGRGLTAEMSKMAMEKGACMISVNQK